MTERKQGREQDWRASSWDGARRRQLRQWAALSLEEILAAQEEMHALAAELGESAATDRESGSSPAATTIREPAAGYGHTTSSPSIPLAGCAPVPLGGYLKALGVLRLVAEQADPRARGYWRDDVFVLTSELGREGLRKFFLEHYRPTPVLAPWNGGSGFYPKDNKSGIGPIEKGSAERLAALRESIRQIHGLMKSLGIEKGVDKQAKARLVTELRNELSEDGLAWLDAAILLAGEGPKYPPLLGTGGNDGRLDFTNNFMQRLVDLFDPDTGEPRGAAADMLDEAIFGEAVCGLGMAAIGQFAPGSAGGPNAASGFEGDSRVNPWSYVLMIEGALLFAAAVTRRLESSQAGALSFPFTVRATGAGSGGAATGDESNARAEMWLPLWAQPSSLGELKALLAEGRATLGRRPARDGLDFARAVARLGVDRGITSFQRYAFFMRSGKAYLATPLNHVRARRNPHADLIDELEGRSRWLARFRAIGRGANAPARAASLVRRLEDALFELAVSREDPAPRVQKILMLLGEAQLYLARSRAARESCPPVPWLTSQWLSLADDGSSEIAMAAALAGLHARTLGPDGAIGMPLPMRIHLAPEDGRPNPAWLEDEGAHTVTWNRAGLDQNLAATLERRMLMAGKLDLADKPLAARATVSEAVIAAWLAGAVDRQQVEALLPGLMLIRIPAIFAGAQLERAQPLPMVFRLLKPFFCTDFDLHKAGLLAADESLKFPSEILGRLNRADLDGALGIAARKLRAAGLLPKQFSMHGAACGRMHGLLPALLAPLPRSNLSRLLPRVGHIGRESRDHPLESEL